MNRIYYITLFFLALQAFCCATVPVSIIIPSGYKCVVSGNVILSVTGNLPVNGTFSATANSNVKFCGTSLQQIGGSSGICTFQDIELNNSSNFKLLGDVTINGITTFTNGCLSTGTKTLILSESASFNPVAGTTAKFIDGKIKKTGNGSPFLFPIGDIQGATLVWAPVEIATWNNTNDFTVSYTFKSPFDSLGYHTWQDGYSLGSGLDHVSGMEFWLIDKTGIGVQNPNVRVYWKDAVRSQIANTGTDYQLGALEDISLVHWNGSQWENMEGTAVAGTWPTGFIQNFINFTSYSPITFGSKTGKNPLPIELLKFSANCNNNSILLEWSTVSEINNNYFSIERSIDTQNWEVITKVQGAGNSNLPLQYSHTDTDISRDGIYYYRLGNTDFNGEIKYSNIITANCSSNSFDNISIYPNPVINDKLNFMVCTAENNEITTSVSNVLGQILVMNKFNLEKGENHLVIDVSTLSRAIYFFKISTKNGLYKDCKQLVIDK